MSKLDLFVTSPTSLSNGYVEWYGLNTKLVGRVNAIIENNKKLQSILNEAIKYIYSNSTRRKIFADIFDAHKNGNPKFYGNINELLEILGEGNEKD